MSASTVSESGAGRPRRWPVTLTVLMGTVAVVLNATVVNVAIPAIMDDLGMSQVAAQWLSTGFLAAMTATMLASARVMERLGQRRTFELALWAFLAACVLAALSPDAPLMIAARVLQGATAGIIQPLALILIFQVFDDSERGKALGIYGMGVVLAPALGPTVGGMLVDGLSWRAVYLPAVPFCLLGLWGARRYLENHPDSEQLPFDWFGLLLLSAGLALVLAGLVTLADDLERGSLLVAVGTGLLAAFVARAATARAPLIRLDVLAYPQFALASGLAMIYGAGLYGSTYLVPLLVQGVQRMSATGAGMLMMPAGLTLLLIFPLAGRLADRVPAHRLILLGCATYTVGMIGVAFSSPTSLFVSVAAWVAVARMALGIMMPALNIGGLRSLPSALTQQGSGMINFARQLGGSFGVNGLALVLQWRVGAHLHGGVTDMRHFYSRPGVTAQALSALTIGFRETFLVLATLFAAGMLIAARMGYHHAKLRKNTIGL